MRFWKCHVVFVRENDMSIELDWREGFRCPLPDGRYGYGNLLCVFVAVDEPSVRKHSPPNRAILKRSMLVELWDNPRVMRRHKMCRCVHICPLWRRHVCARLNQYRCVFFLSCIRFVCRTLCPSHVENRARPGASELAFRPASVVHSAYAVIRIHICYDRACFVCAPRRETVAIGSVLLPIFSYLVGQEKRRFLPCGGQ